jgi:hypothetical protein
MHVWQIQTIGVALTAALSGCGLNPAHGGRSVEPAQPILIQDGANYEFEPSLPASDDDVVTAEQAWMTLGGDSIPATVTATYGYLTEDDTSPPADRMPVWAFRVRGNCISAFKATNAQCDKWSFARASDGKDLHVGDQRTVP